MNKTLSRYVLPILLTGLIIVTPAINNQMAKADDGNYYNFDYEDFWKEYLEWNYLPGSRLPCNGAKESSCTWPWKPWYRHTTNVPAYDSERYTPRTVSGYALMMRDSNTSSHNLDAGIFRTETAKMCRTYRFTMYARSGLDRDDVPASSDARMQIGISPTGFAPGQIVITDADQVEITNTDQVEITDTDLSKITWSDAVNPQYVYQNLSIEVQALGSSVTLFTRANPTSDNNPYFFWDEGSFTEVSRTSNLVDGSQTLPTPTGGLYSISAYPNPTSALIMWTTENDSLGQILYREVLSTTTPTSGDYKVYLPLVSSSGGSWLYTSLQTWSTSHSIEITGLRPDTEYEYIVTSYGSYTGECKTLVSETASPRTFTTTH